MTIFIVIISFEFMIMVGLLVFKLINWRAVFKKKYGNDYRKGLMQTKLGDTWEETECWFKFEGDKGVTYSYNGFVEGKKAILDVVVPDDIGYDFIEGRRVFKVSAGMVLAYCGAEDTTTNFSAELLSSHILDRIVVTGVKTLLDAKGINWTIIILAILGVGAVILVLKLTGVIGAVKVVPSPTPKPTPGIGVPLNPASMIINVIEAVL
jgi:hypothetical protein